jgi:hypothetical protein
VARQLTVVVVVASATALVIGIPTDVVPNPWFGRVIGVRVADVVVLVVLSLLTGALAATYTAGGGSGPGASRAGLGSGVLGWFAIGCPVCNKLVLLLLGASGATSVFEPIQPILGAAAIGLASAALVLRLRAIRQGACPSPAIGSQSVAEPSRARPAGWL